jgi:hypothetical protein
MDPIGEAEQIRDRVLLLRSTGENDTEAVTTGSKRPWTSTT